MATARRMALQGQRLMGLNHQLDLTLREMRDCPAESIAPWDVDWIRGTVKHLHDLWEDWDLFAKDVLPKRVDDSHGSRLSDHVFEDKIPTPEHWPTPSDPETEGDR